MREILFKAKRIDNGEWVEGSLLIDEAGNCYMGVYIFPRQQTGIEVGGRANGKTNRRFRGIGFTRVDPNTICQYTGLCDKNGNKIWENDVIFAGDNTVVTWNEYYASWSLTKKGWMYSHFFGESVDAKEDCVVVGNIFDNPELLGGADNG